MLKKILFGFLILQFGFSAVTRDKVISLAPNITETICYLSGTDRLAGITNDCNYPPAVKNITRVGKYTYPDLEKIIILQPAVVIAEQSADPRFLQALTEKKVTYKLYDFKNMDKYFSEVTRLNNDLGLNGLSKINRLKLLWQMHKRSGLNKKIIILLWQEPYIVAGQDVYLTKYFEHIGYYNIIKQKNYPTIDPEVFYKDGLDIVINISGRKLKLTKVKAKVVDDLDQDILMRLSPRLVEYYEKICI